MTRVDWPAYHPSPVEPKPFEKATDTYNLHTCTQVPSESHLPTIGHPCDVHTAAELSSERPRRRRP